jgi:hypothetical protein
MATATRRRRDGDGDATATRRPRQRDGDATAMAGNLKIIST